MSCDRQGAPSAQDLNHTPRPVAWVPYYLACLFRPQFSDITIGKMQLSSYKGFGESQLPLAVFNAWLERAAHYAGAALESHDGTWEVLGVVQGVQTRFQCRGSGLGTAVRDRIPVAVT